MTQPSWKICQCVLFFTIESQFKKINHSNFQKTNVSTHVPNHSFSQICDLPIKSRTVVITSKKCHKYIHTDVREYACDISVKRDLDVKSKKMIPLISMEPPLAFIPPNRNTVPHAVLGCRELPLSVRPGSVPARQAPAYSK